LLIAKIKIKSVYSNKALQKSVFRHQKISEFLLTAKIKIKSVYQNKAPQKSVFKAPKN